ncbi:MAG: SDR family NAD(P)-dependent oxidoreductase [Gemmatimonadales bacterium]
MRSALVTGATKGIGWSTALLLDHLGWRVFAGYRSAANADALRRHASARLTPIQLDVTNDDDQASAAEAVGPSLDALINNAGVVVTGPLEFIPPDQLDMQFAINVRGPVTLIQRLLPALRTAQGRIVNVSSVNGRLAMPFSLPYAASKFALEAVSDGLRVELRRWGIRTVLVEPGAIATPLWDTSRERAVRTFSDLPAEASQLYGGTFAALARVRTPRRAIPPERVARIIVKALTARHPRARYVVGWDARFGILSKALLPTWLLDLLMARWRRT